MSDPGTAHDRRGARVAVIPARGGSKRVPRKNVRVLDGRPLIAWTIDTCLTAGCFDRVVVSTDDDEVADVARTAGAEVPFIRDASLSDDHTPLARVMADAVRQLALTDADTACCVYPTSIGLAPTDLTAGADLLDQPGSPYVVAVVRYSHPIQRALVLEADHELTMVEPTLALERTQDLPPRWHDAGQFVWGRADAWLSAAPVLTAARGVEVPAWRVVDLDTEDDWARAELVHALLRGNARGNRLG